MDILAESAIRITLLALGVAFVLRMLRIRSPRLVHGAWTAVVLVMLLLPAVVASGPEFALPVLPSNTAIRLLAPSAVVAESAGTPARNGVSPASPASGDDQRRMTWATAAMAVYVAGVGLLLIRLAIGLRHARTIRREAVEVHGRLTHPACITPMTIGLGAPAVILPPDWANWHEAELSAVLAHEEEHARRRDPLVAALALVNRAIFWFHPLAWWLQREIGRLSEQACDTVVIARGHDTALYASCLVRFARQASAAGGRIVPTAVAMPGAGLRERLGMLAGPPPVSPSGSRLTCAAVACAALVIVCAATVPTAARAQTGRLPGPAPTAWRVDTSEHFQIVHAGLPADRVLDAIRDAEIAYGHLSAALKYDMNRRVTIVLVARDRDIGATIDTPPATQTSASDQRLFISLESLGRGTGLMVHELTHSFAFDIIPSTSRLSPFLIEGLAEHQRGAWDTKDLGLIRADVAADAIPSIASLGATDRHWAHAVFDFVAAQEGAEGVRRLLFALRAHDTLVQAVPMAFGVTLEQFDQALRGYTTTRFGQR